MRKGLVVLSLLIGIFPVSALDMRGGISSEDLSSSLSLTPTPTPQSPPPTIGKIVPQDLPAISPQNIDGLSVVAQWGRGIPQDIEYSKDGSWLGIASTNGVYLFDPLDLNAEPVFFLISPSITTITFNPQGSHFAAGRIDGTVEVWDIDKKVRTHLIDYEDWDYIYDLALSDEGILIVDSVAFHGIRVFDLEGADPQKQIFFAPGFSFAVSPDFERLAVTGEGGSIGNLTVWDLATQKRIDFQDNSSMAVVYDKDSKNLLVGTFHGEIQVWDRDAKNLIYDFGLLAAEYSSGQTYFCENVALGRHEPPAPEYERPNAIRLDYSPDNDLLAVVYYKHKGAITPDPIIYNAATGERLWAFGKEADELTISGDGSTIASITIDTGEVNLWDAYTGEPLGSIFGFTSFVGGIQFTPDGKAISMRSEGKYELRLTKDGSLWRTIKSEALAFSPDGKMVAVGQEDGRVELRRAEDFSLIKTLDAHNDSITALAFSKDSSSIASAASDCSLKLTRVSDTEVLWLEVYAPSDFNDPFLSLRFTGNGNYILGIITGYPYIFNANNGELYIEPDYKHSIIGLNPIRDEIIYDDLRVWDVEADKLLNVLDSVELEGYRAEYAPNGSLLVAHTRDKDWEHQITIWGFSGPKNEIVATLFPTSRSYMYGSIQSFVFSPDGSLLVVVGGNGILYFYGVTD